jgi:hypothetical protein
MGVQAIDQTIFPSILGKIKVYTGLSQYLGKNILIYCLHYTPRWWYRWHLSTFIAMFPKILILLDVKAFHTWLTRKNKHTLLCLLISIHVFLVNIPLSDAIEMSMCSFALPVLPMCSYLLTALPMCSFVLPVLPMCSFALTILSTCSFNLTVLPMCSFVLTVLQMCYFVLTVLPMCSFVSTVLPMCSFANKRTHYR